MPQAETQKKTIDGNEFEVAMLPPRAARKILIDMVKVLGPALGGVVTAVGGSSKTALQNILNADIGLVGLITSVTEHLNDEMLERHQGLLAQVTLVDGKPLDRNFDAFFRGRIGAMFEWHVFALMVNFSDFKRALESVSSLLPAPKATQASSSPNT